MFFSSVEVKGILEEAPTEKQFSSGVEADRNNHSVVYYFDGQPVRSIELSSTSDNPITVSIYCTDQGNALYYEMGTIEFERNEYMIIHSYGEVESVCISYSTSDNADINAEFNTQKPMDFGARRLLSLYALLLVAYALLSGSLMWEAHATKRFCFMVAFVAVIVSVAAIWYSQASYSHYYEHHRQYYELAIALCNGELCLDTTPSEALVHLDNPYDTELRTMMGVEALGDHAYYAGRYYVYFGVLPALVFHLPWYVLTGGEFLNWVGVAIVVSGFMIGTAFFLMAASDEVPLSRKSFLLMFLIVITGSFIVHALRYPDLYVLPISMAQTLSIWGIALWLRATAESEIRIGFGVLGSLLMALVLLCRPQLFLVSLVGIAIIIVWRSKKKAHVNAKVTALLLVPYFAVFVAAGLYNYARFGSAVDFGASYNLTTNDMTHRTMSVEQLVQGLFAYLIQPPFVTLEWPYIQTTEISAYYYGKVIAQGTSGGIFMICPILLVLLLVFQKQMRQALRQSGSLILVLFLLGSGVVLAGFDAVAAGLLRRYYLDFGFPLALGAILVVVEHLHVRSRCSEESECILLEWAFSLLAIAGLGFQLIMFCTTVYP